jgi:TonB family protein
LGPAKTNTWYTDPYQRIWQERVWAVPFLDIYVVGELLPTPDGYAAIMTYVPSAYLRECQSRLRLLTGQLGISMRGSLKQWREYLQRRSILPAALSGVKLASTSGWTLETPQFAASIPPSAVALTEDSLLTLTMGFTRDGSHARWDVTDTWWFKDNRMEDGVGLSRRQNPPSGAKLELRNTFASMRERRAPYDGGMLRDSAETFSTTRVLEVPGKSAGTVSADLLYALTLRMIGHPTLADANRTMQTLIEGIRILERGVGDDIKGATSVNGDSVDHGEDAWQRLISVAEKNDAATGKDIRGHTYSQDLRNLYEAAKARAKTSVIVPLASALEEPMQSKAFQDLVEYWKNYPALSHNRDLWVSYLARNKMPLETSHDGTVIAAENALTSALNGGSPTSEWAERAHALTAAYIAERDRRLTNHEVSPDDFRQRVSPCPTPAEKALGAEKTPGKKPPSYSRMNRSLEDFWPPESKRLGEEGIVRVSIRISSEGCALAAAIVASSGSPMLDEAVLKFYETIDFHPGEIDGNAVEVTTTVPVNFKLRN